MAARTTDTPGAAGEEVEYLAHVGQDASGRWRVHRLEDHLREVARLAAQFASPFGGQEWARIAGLWHDLGKYRAAFQSYIGAASGYDPEAHIEHGRVDHSTAGAIHAVGQHGAAGTALAYLIAGHHAGLADWDSGHSGQSALSIRIPTGKDKGYLSETLKEYIPDDIRDPQFTMTKPLGGRAGVHLWMRMLFSCLVDADFLDTERFMDPAKSHERSVDWSMSTLRAEFDAYMHARFSTCCQTPVNEQRATVLNDCRTAGEESPGIYTLTVPTGGGKTLASMAFALEHAVKHGKRRIIVAIPYTSIIEQTAQQYREIFGDAVLEHHSNLDPDAMTKENSRLRLATENWDAPIVVTTNVQLFESLYAVRTSRCRKLHNIVDSVIVLDEAQLLPPDYLQPILSSLRLLTEHFGVTLLLSTATQPALQTRTDTFGRTLLQGLDAKREIVSDVDGLFNALKRVAVDVPADLNEQTSWEGLAVELSDLPCVLVVVNTRRDARELHRLMPAGTIHLSAQMCGEHRSNVIAAIKQKLESGKSVRVVSTQLVEAGVDLDFPVVYRALAGLDSIAQAAGRCNREGTLARGRVVVFVPPAASPRGLLLYGEQATRSIWHARDEDPLSHKRFQDYFHHYFTREDHDKHHVLDPLVTDAGRGCVQFRTAEQRFRMIDDAGTSILVPYGDAGFKYLDMLRTAGPKRSLMRKLQRYAVNVHDGEFEKLRQLGAIEELQPGMWGLCITNGYDDELGLLQADDLFGSQSGLI